MSKATAQKVTVTMDDDGSQTVLIYPAAQKQTVPPIGLTIDEEQTIEIEPAG